MGSGTGRRADRPQLFHLRAAVVQTQAMASKVDIYGGKNPRELPLYTIADAARVVRIHPATLRTWVLGRSYDTQGGSKTWRPLIRRADPKVARLSFTNLVEIHVLSALRGKKVQVDHIRSATPIHSRKNEDGSPAC